MKFQRSKVSVEIGTLNFRKVYNSLRVMAEGNEDLPRDAQVVKLLLKSMGVEDYEPRVVHQFLELWYRYAADVLTDAQVYSDYAGKTGIDCDDVKLAVQSKVNFSFSQPPPRKVLLELARNLNKVPLPDNMGAGTSIPLPPDDDTLISPNYQLLIPNKQNPHAQEETEEEEEEAAAAAAAPSSSQEPKATHQPPQLTSQRVSFPLGSMRPQIQ